MRYAGEVFRPEGKGGAPPAGEGEASREERKRARAAKKRAGKKHAAQKVGQMGSWRCIGATNLCLLTRLLSGKAKQCYSAK